MYQNIILPFRIIIIRQSRIYRRKISSLCSNHRSTLPVMEKYNCRFSSDSTNKTDIDTLIDEEFENRFKDLESFSDMGTPKFENMRTKMENLKPIIFEEISKGNPEVIKRLNALDFELNLLKNEGFNVPFYLTKSHYENLLELKSTTAKKKFLNFVFRNQCSMRNKENKKLLNCVGYILKQNRLGENNSENSDLDLVEKDLLYYALGHNSMFLRFRKHTLRNLIYERLFVANSHSPHIVFDCSFDNYMSPLTLKSCAEQLNYCFLANSFHPAPFHVKLCNFHKNSNLAKQLCKLFETMGKEEHPWDFHEEDFLDLYDHKRIVYLTPDCYKELQSYNPNDVYIIGAYNDKASTAKASISIAKEKNLRVARFPIDTYVKWKQGSKSLSLNVVTSILLDLRLYNDWNIAFRNLPSRKIFSPKTKLT